MAATARAASGSESGPTRRQAPAHPSMDPSGQKKKAELERRPKKRTKLWAFAGIYKCTWSLAYFVRGGEPSPSPGDP
ncbi:predicted protein [Chaetomium globosum CBS 148.51]|uniref:Uncharacterized protein n=1 Tax=Chaetomium globosum (strain ATCC 6205 / CBS 148.51 / DSM 1962 / NBRC 6347 / NRRL 1970) TaxID=306901 RepID=Q2HGQ7_CHAGB|nr:uncharacterized protein CHGG_00597 [Chaetomium globosum CBS 148.51]EAQ92362.1 predicted protein [Chaetomium globosum CBS 148.51]